MFNCIDIYSFIHVSGGVCMGPIGLLCPGAYNAVKMVLDIMLSCFVCYKQSDWLKGVITCIFHIIKY